MLSQERKGESGRTSPRRTSAGGCDRSRKGGAGAWGCAPRRGSGAVRAGAGRTTSVSSSIAGPARLARKPFTVSTTAASIVLESYHGGDTSAHFSSSVVSRKSRSSGDCRRTGWTATRAMKGPRAAQRLSSTSGDGRAAPRPAERRPELTRPPGSRTGKSVPGSFGRGGTMMPVCPGEVGGGESGHRARREPGESAGCQRGGRCGVTAPCGGQARLGCV